MGLTLQNVVGPEKVGSLAWSAKDVTWDNSYATGGESLSLSSLGFDSGYQVLSVLAQPVGGLSFGYDFVNQKLKAYSAIDSSKPFAYSPGGGDIKGATAITGVMGTADQASGPTNANLIADYATFTDINTAVGVLTIAADLDVPRNVVITVKNDQGGGTGGTLYEGTQTATVVGTFRGAAQTEDIAITSTAGNKTIADTKFRSWAGAKPFDSITSITLDHTTGPTGALKLAVGPGTKLGFPTATDTGANADVLKFTVNAANRAISGNSDYTNQTFAVGTISDGADISIVYNADYDVPGGTPIGSCVPLSEVPSGTNLSTITTRVFAWAGR